jgi:hypothetical protein
VTTVKKYLLSLAFIALALIGVLPGSTPEKAQAQPCSWNYSFVNGVSTATYCGNVQSLGPSSESNINIVSLGADPTGKIDAHAIFQTALNSIAATGGQISFPCGTYLMSGDVSVSLAAGKHLSIHGDGQDCAIVDWNAGNDLTVNYGNQYSSIYMSDITWATGSATSSEPGLVLINANPVTLPSAKNIIEYVTFRGFDGYAQTDFWATAVSIQNVWVVDFISGYQVGPLAVGGVGTKLVGDVAAATYSGQYNFIGTTFLDNAAGISYGSYIQGVTVNQANFTGDTNGILVPSSQLGSLSQLSVTGSQFQTGQAGIQISTATGGVSVKNSLFFVIPSQAGIAGALVSFDVIGNTFEGSSISANDGVHITSQGGVGVVDDNNFSTVAVGVLIDSGASLIQVPANVNSNVTTPVTDNGTNDIIGYQTIVVPTVTNNAGTCTAGSFAFTQFQVGQIAGHFTAGACTVGTFILAGLPATTTAWSCTASDWTTPADTVKQTAGTAVGGITFLATTAASDFISLNCNKY